MANFDNPLDKYRSFSYHYIMTVSNTTEAQRKLTTVNGTRSGFLDAVENVKLGDKLRIDDDAYLLVDTRRFSQFTVKSFQTEQIYGTGPVNNPSVPASQSTLRLYDATGLSFYNFLMDILQNKLKTTRTSALFTLAIMFMGHTHDGKTEKISECFIPMIMLTMGFEFTSSGTEFEITMIEVRGNPSRAQPAMTNLRGILCVSTEGRKNTVGGMIQCLEDSLNMDSITFYQKYNNKALTIANEEQKSQFIRAGKLVQYMITIPREWRDFQIDSATMSNHIEQVFTARKLDTEKQANQIAAQAAVRGASAADVQKLRSSYISFNDEMNIFDAIKTILESTKEYLDLGSLDKRLEGRAQTHKTLMSVTSDANTYVLHFDVVPFAAPKTKMEITTGNNPSAYTAREVRDLEAGQKNKDKSIVKNLIEYDYIFTGKNSHVLDLKIQFIPESIVGLDRDVDLGQKRFARMANGGAKTGQVLAAQAAQKKQTEDFVTMCKPNDPLFMPPKTLDQRSGAASLQTEEKSDEDAAARLHAKQDHTSTLAFFHFVSSQQLQLTIRGNPNLLKKYVDVNTRGGIAVHPSSLISTDILKRLTNQNQDAKELFTSSVSTTLKNAKERYFEEFVQPIINKSSGVVLEGNGLAGGDVAIGPVYVKLNIKAPNVDANGIPIDGQPLYTDKFFYSGAYMVLQILHDFTESGGFTQTMMLTPADFDGSYSASARAA